jgi:hypothetical protein
MKSDQVISTFSYRSAPFQYYLSLFLACRARPINWKQSASTGSHCDKFESTSACGFIVHFNGDYATGWTVRLSNSGGGNRIFCFSKMSSPVLVATRSPVECVRGLFPGGRTAGAWSSPLVPKLRMSGAEILFLLYAFMAWTGKSSPFYLVWNNSEQDVYQTISYLNILQCPF